MYRCRNRACDSIYTIYTGTVFEGHQLTPRQVVLLLRGVLKGEPTAMLARELALSRMTVHTLRKELQANAEWLQPESSLSDEHTETDEMFQNAGEKR